METVGTCPSERELASFAHGGTAVGVALSEHLATCATCTRAVIRLVKTAPQAVADLPTLPRGTMIGRYKIAAVLGAGGMGVVYRAHDQELDRDVALKLVLPTATAVEDLAERLITESRLQARANHRAVITVYDVGRVGDEVFVAMELVKGTNLREWITSCQDWRDVLDVFCEAGAGLAAAHSAGLVHRDFKPDNVLVEANPQRDGIVTRAGDKLRVLVADFGVARALREAEHQARVTATFDATADAPLDEPNEMVIGTPGYMAPEQLHGGDIDARADVYAFAVSLWEALYGVRPYDGLTVVQVAAAMTEPLAAPPVGRLGRVPSWIEQHLRAALALERTQRTSAIMMVVDQLDWRRVARKRRTIAVASAAALGLLGGGAAVTVVALTGENPTVVAGPCDDPTAPSELARRIDHPRPGLAPAHAERARDFAHRWTELRASECRQPAPVAAHVRCFDLRARGFGSYLDHVATAPADRQGALLRGSWTPPEECARATPEIDGSGDVSEAAVERDARYRFKLASAEGDDGALAKLADEVAREAPRLVNEVAYARARIATIRQRNPLPVRTLIGTAERAGNLDLAARIAINLYSQQLEQGAQPEALADLFTLADTLITRAGDPPAERLSWRMHRCWLRLQSPNAEGARDELTAIEREVTSRGVELSFVALGRLGLSWYMAGDFNRARELTSKAIETAERDGFSTEQTLLLRTNYALALSESGHTDEALAMLARDVTAVTPEFQTESIARALAFYAQLLNSQGRGKEILALFDRWQPAIDRLRGDRSVAYGKLMFEWGDAHGSVGQSARAVGELRRALEVYVELFGAKGPATADVRISLAQSLYDTRQFDDALDQVERGIADMTAVSSAADGRVLQGRLLLGQIELARGHNAVATTTLTAVLDGWTKNGQTPPAGEIGRVQLSLAKAIVTRDRKRAATLVKTAIPDLERGGDVTAADLKEARRLAARL